MDFTKDALSGELVDIQIDHGTQQDKNTGKPVYNAIVWQDSLWLGLIVGVSMFLAITMTTTLGVLIPIFFRSIKIDPAVASGPLVTMLNDIIGLLVYLSLATLYITKL